MLGFSVALEEKNNQMAFKKFEKFEKSDKFDKFEKDSFPPKKRKWSPVFDNNVTEIDFKDTRILSRFVTERGRILPRRITGLNAQQQKMVTKAIKRARQMSLLPFISYGS